MKILIVILRHKGGVGNANRELARCLRKRGHQVDILSREDDLNIYGMLDGLIPLREKIIELEQQNIYDIIYTNDYSMTLSLLFPYHIYKNKHICCFCGYKLRDRGIHHVLQHFVGWKMGKNLVVIGDNIKEKFPKATTIYRGINFDKFFNKNMERKYIGLIKRDTETLTEEEIKEIGKKTNLPVLIAEDIPQEKMNDFYNKLKVFISTPKCGGWNNSWNEAMACEVPLIIGNEIGGGRILPLEKASDVELCTKLILSSNLNEGGSLYRKWLKINDFSWDAKSKQLEEFFNEVKFR